ncbi:hypothetical protein ACFYZU_28680 [Streptomyces sp. NPDC001651]|uniref:hypothetical protein n=1 Tax=unclassified Streptomyces TaxID=2593676 RepID=UPI003681507F
MLIDMVKLATFPGRPWLAAVRTSFGHAAVRWRGKRAAEPGEYHVEWTIDEDITWGHNAKPAIETGPGLRTGGHCVVLRGQLSPIEDGAALLDFAGTKVLQDLTDPLPEDVADTWGELFIDSDKVSVYPYVL